MKGKIAGLFATVLIAVFSLFGAAACGGLQNEVKNPVRQATEQIEEAREAQQQVEELQQRQQPVEEER